LRRAISSLNISEIESANFDFRGQNLEELGWIAYEIVTAYKPAVNRGGEELKLVRYTQLSIRFSRVVE
jgi:hypothetical protein